MRKGQVKRKDSPYIEPFTTSKKPMLLAMDAIQVANIMQTTADLLDDNNRHYRRILKMLRDVESIASEARDAANDARDSVRELRK